MSDDIHQDILKLVQDNPRGLSIQDLSDGANMNRNTITRYIDVLVAVGQLEMRRVGIAKLYYPSKRVALHTLLDYSHEGIMIFNQELKVIQINDACEELMGISSDEMVDKKVGEAPAVVGTNPVFKDLIQRALDGEQVTKELELLLNDNPRYFDVNALPTTFIDGKIGCTLIIKDITEKKTIEKQLEASRELYSSVVNSSNDAIIICQNGIIRFVNKPGLQLLEYPMDKIIDKKLFDFLTPETQETDCCDELKKGTRTGRLVEKFFHKPDGNLVPLEISASPIVYKKTPATLLYLRDITERKKLETRALNSFKLGNLITNLSLEYLNHQKGTMDQILDKTLKKVGEFAQVDRSYIFKFSPDGVLMNNTHEWCAKDVQPQIDNLQGIPVEIFQWEINKLSKGEVIHVPSVKDLPPVSEAVKNILEQQDIQSILVVPIMFEEKPVGLIGFASGKQPKTWHDEDIELLKLVSRLVAVALG